MENAINRLERAIDYAMLHSASGSSDQRGAFYARLACALATQGLVNDTASITQLPNFEALCDVLPIIVSDESGNKSLHAIWDAPNFVAPAVAALAILFERTTHPRGDSLLTMHVSRQQNALYGYHLDRLSAAAFDYSAEGVRVERPMNDNDWMKVSTILAGAALAFMKDLNFMRFAPFYLDRMVTGTIPDGSHAPLPSGRSPFINLSV